MATQTAPVEEASPTLPGIPEVMAAISTCQAALTGKLEAVQMDIGLIRQDLDPLPWGRRIAGRPGGRHCGEACGGDSDPTNQGEGP